MKLQNVIVQPEVAATSQNDSHRARREPLPDYFTRLENAGLRRVGQLLNELAPDGRKRAEVVAGGESVEMETIPVDGNTLPLAADTVLSLASIAEWCCPACGSAHGTGVHPSREVSAKLLATNQFYYCPSDQRLFVISDTCLQYYGEKLSAADPPAHFAVVTPQVVAIATGCGTSSENIDVSSHDDNAGENATSLADQTDAVDSLNKRMGTLDDSDLWNNLNYFYPMFHNLVSTVAKDVGMSIGHVQRVLDGDRKSAEIQVAITSEFRRRIQTNYRRGARSDEAVPNRIRSAGQTGENAQVKLQNVTVPKLCDDGVGSEQNGKQTDRKKANETPLDASENSKLYRLARLFRRAWLWCLP